MPRFARGKLPGEDPVKLFMRNVVVLLSLLATTGAIAGPSKPCRISLKGSNFDVGCLPALSARGTLVAVAVVDPDGDRGLPNLQVAFIPIDDRPAASTVVLTADEVGPLRRIGLSAFLQQLGAILAREPRLDLVNAQLSVAGFGPLKAIGTPSNGETGTESGGMQFTVKNGILEIRGRRIETETVPLPHPSPADCEDANTPFVRGMWASAADDRDIVVRIDYTGNAACPEPRPAWRVLHVRNASAGGQTAGASVLNTRGMRKFRARDWVGAAADFRAAIDISPDHVKAHYNLACLAAITGDRDTALAQLRWLAASDLAEAGQRIAKARTDPDMTFIRDDPEVHAILQTR